MASEVVSISEMERIIGTTLGTDDRAYMAMLEKAAIQWFERKTNRTLADAGTITEYRNGTGLRDLALFNDATAITSVAYWNGSEWDVLTSTDYELYDGNKVTRRDGGVWETGTRNIRIIYTGGYDDGQVPEDIALAIAGWMLNEWRRSRGSDNVEDGVPSWVEGLVNEWIVADYALATPLLRA